MRYGPPLLTVVEQVKENPIVEHRKGRCFNLLDAPHGDENRNRLATRAKPNLKQTSRRVCVRERELDKRRFSICRNALVDNMRFSSCRSCILLISSAAFANAFVPRSSVAFRGGRYEKMVITNAVGAALLNKIPVLFILTLSCRPCLFHAPFDSPYYPFRKRFPATLLPPRKHPPRRGKRPARMRHRHI